MRSRTFQRLVAGAALPLAAVAGLTTFSSTGASARDAFERTLQELCEKRGGDFFDTPFDFGRCQTARPRRGVDDPLAAERHVCAVEFGGAIRSTPSFERPKRISWNCI